MKKILVSFALIISLLALSACGDSNETSQGTTPVYQGMVLTSREDQSLTSLLPTRLSAIFLNDEDNQGDEGESNVEEPSPDLLIEGGNYYAGKNQDIVVNIKISNPDSFEILSFTLNGYKYQSYEFEDGSNSTDLYLTVSTGDIEGLKEYTIDNIKYVDGTEIKDVIIDGDETVEVSIYKDIPIFDNSVTTDLFSISGELVITDVDSAIIEDSLVLKLVNEDAVIDETTDLLYSFNGLLTGHEYTLELFGIIDMNDVNGEQEIMLYSQTVSTVAKAVPTVEINTVVPTQDSVTFNIDITDVDSVGSITAIELYQGETLIESLTDLSLSEFTGLLSNNEYTVKVTYTYDLNDGVGEQTEQAVYTVSTLVKATPTIEVTNVVAQQEEITFELDITDVDTVGSLTSIELYQGETLIESLSDLSLREFTGLLSNNAYTIQTTYTYDLNDGVGEQTEVITYDAITLASSISVQRVDILNSIIYTSTNISLRLQIDNPDYVDLTYITINGSKYPTQNLNNNQTILVNIGSIGEPGSFEMLFDEIEYTSDFGSITIALADIYIKEVSVISELDILTIDTESGNEYLVLNGENYIKVAFSNPSNFMIESITINWDLKMNVIYETGAVGTSSNNGSLTSVIGEFIDYSSDGYILIPFTPTNPSTNDGLIRITVVEVQFYVSQYDITESANYLTSEIFSLVNNTELIEIFTAEDLQNIQNGYAYILMNDIDMTGYNWVPKHFSGYFDGNNHTIFGISIIEDIVSTVPHSYCGFFRSINGIIKNFTLQDIYINVSANNYLLIGGLSGAILEFSVVHDVEINGIINGNSSHSAFIGGVIGSYSINYEWDTLKYFYNNNSSIVFLGSAENNYITGDIVGSGNGW